MMDNFEEELKREITLKGGAKQVMSEEVAYMISDILAGVLRGGTATSAMYEAGFTRRGQEEVPEKQVLQTIGKMLGLWDILLNLQLVYGLVLTLSNILLEIIKLEEELLLLFGVNIWLKH